MSGKLKKNLKKRKPGAGRKPAGPFKNNTAQLTIRMPDDLRRRLERSAKKKRWSLSQELLYRLRVSYGSRHEEQFQPPATRAICFLVGHITGMLTLPEVQDRNLALWHRDPFQFRAFRLAVSKLLEALEPRGDIQSPYGPLLERLPDLPFWSTQMTAFVRTPEILADWVVTSILGQMLNPRSEIEASIRETSVGLSNADLKRYAEHLSDSLYDIARAKRDLEIGDPAYPSAMKVVSSIEELR